MGEYFKYYLVAAVLFSLIDFIWLGLVAKKFYTKAIGKLLLNKPNLPAAVIFYLLFIVGLVVFAIVPASQESDPVLNAFRLGALFGFFTYLTYDFTNLATLKGWPVKIVAVDVIWGTVLSSVVAGLTGVILF